MKIVCSILFLFVLSVKGVISRRPDIRYLKDPVSCSFEEGNFCGWNDDPRDVLAWWQVIHLPEFHTHAACLHLSTSPFFVESGDKLIVEGSARLWSGQVRSHPTNKIQCLGFKYIVLFNKRLPHIRLNLMKHSTGSCITVQKGLSGDTSLTCDNKGLFKSGNQLSSDEWLKIMVDLPPTNTDYKLILEGTIPAGYPDARICVDNITSYTEPCSALEKASAPLPSQWSWAQYFGLTFVGALILGLLIPVLFLVILIWACRRRHHAMHSNYTNSKLFSTNLWYYIGGKEICDDPNGFRGSSSMLRSKQFNSPSATGTLLNGGGGGHHLMLSNADVMDLPDVVVPGGRVVAFNYSGNTLGGNTLRHNHNNAGYTNTNYLSNAQNNQVMLTNVNGTVSLNNCGTNVTTVARTGQNTMPLVSNELIQQQSQSQQQNEAYNYQTNPVFGESVSMAVMTASQSPMLMTQSMAPNYGSEANHVAQSNFSNCLQSVNHR
uniref:MAM domain-containing protein n=1 Tax=Schistosoma mansoni TaxID=6183 RepID=A0A5K4F7P9_SCHMA